MTKFGVTRWMEESQELASHLPETRMLTEIDFVKMIAKYGEVVVKPDVGNRGRGVFKVSSKDSGEYEIHIEDQVITKSGVNETYGYLLHGIGSEAYIVQQRVGLAEIDGCIMEIRVIVQRKTIEDPWKVTGRVAKVAGKGYVVSNNERSHGTVLPVGEATEKSSLKNVSISKLVSEIDRTVLIATERLTEYYLNRNERIYGYDIGIDNNGHVWIIEVNLEPMLSHFSKLKDQTLYHRILRILNYRKIVKTGEEERYTANKMRIERILLP